MTKLRGPSIAATTNAPGESNDCIEAVPRMFLLIDQLQNQCKEIGILDDRLSNVLYRLSGKTTDADKTGVSEAEGLSGSHMNKLSEISKTLGFLIERINTKRDRKSVV